MCVEWPSRRAAGPARRRRENERDDETLSSPPPHVEPTAMAVSGGPKPWLESSRGRTLVAVHRYSRVYDRGAWTSRRVSLEVWGDSRPPRRARRDGEARAARSRGRGGSDARLRASARRVRGCAKARMAVGSRRVPRSAGARRAVTTSAKGVSQRPPCGNSTPTSTKITHPRERQLAFLCGVSTTRGRVRRMLRSRPASADARGSRPARLVEARTPEGRSDRPRSAPDRQPRVRGARRRDARQLFTIGLSRTRSTRIEGPERPGPGETVARRRIASAGDGALHAARNEETMACIVGDLIGGREHDDVASCSDSNERDADRDARS